YIPRGTYNTGSTPSFGPSTLLLPEQPNPVHLIGDGASLTILQASSNSNDLLRIRADGSTVRGIAFIGTNQPGTARGIVIGRQTSGSGLVAPSIKDAGFWITLAWASTLMEPKNLQKTLGTLGPSHV